MMPTWTSVWAGARVRWIEEMQSAGLMRNGDDVQGGAFFSSWVEEVDGEFSPRKACEVSYL